jgi:hypothetical protein
MEALARAPIGDQREGGRGTGRAAQALSERVIHNITHGLVPLGCAEFRLPKKIVVYDEGGSHMYEHIYMRIIGRQGSDPFARRALVQSRSLGQSILLFNNLGMAPGCGKERVALRSGIGVTESRAVA